MWRKNIVSFSKALHSRGRIIENNWNKNVISHRQRSLNNTRTFATYFSEKHEWLEVDGNVGTLGITNHAQEQLGDIVYCELPAKGDTFEVDDAVATVESVKAASEIFAPVDGEVICSNDELESNPGLINKSPQSKGWFTKIKIKDTAELDKLMDEEAYNAFIESESAEA